MKIDEFNLQGVVEYFLQITNNQKKYNLLLSGGSTPIPIYKKLALTRFNYPNNFMLTDERAVKPTSIKSNATMLKKTKLLGVLEKNSNYCKILTGENFNNGAIRVNKTLQLEFKSNNIVIIGVGLDGHIAGIMPTSNALTSNNLFEYNKNLVQDKSRLTITKKFIQEFATKVIVLVNKDKVDFIKANINNTTLPLNILHNKSNVEFIALKL